MKIHQSVVRRYSFTLPEVEKGGSVCFALPVSRGEYILGAEIYPEGFGNFLWRVVAMPVVLCDLLPSWKLEFRAMAFVHECASLELWSMNEPIKKGCTLETFTTVGYEASL